MSEMECAGMPRPDPDAAPLWAWMRWIDSHDRVRSRPDRRCQDFRGQYDDFDLVHLRVDEHRVLLTDFDRYHAVLNNAPCEPISAVDDWSPEKFDAWLDGHWNDSAEEKRRQWHDNVIVQAGVMPDSWVQACLWGITPEDVVDVRCALMRKRR